MRFGTETSYAKLPMADLQDLCQKYGIEAVWAALDTNGLVTREVGFASDGRVVHRCPGAGPMGRYGIFDLVQFGPDALKANLTKEEFDAAYDPGTAISHPQNGD